MSPARELLDELALLGATVQPTGDRLILRAGPSAIPAALVRRVREAKSDLVAILMANSRPRHSAGADRTPNKDPEVAFCNRIVGWLNEHSAPSPAGRCAWCDRPESVGAVVLPFGTLPGTHTWLHAECWPAWHQKRRDDAMRELAAR